MGPNHIILKKSRLVNAVRIEKEYKIIKTFPPLDWILHQTAQSLAAKRAPSPEKGPRPGQGADRKSFRAAYGRQYSAIQKYCRMLPASTNRCQTKCIYFPWDL